MADADALHPVISTFAQDTPPISEIDNPTDAEHDHEEAGDKTTLPPSNGDLHIDELSAPPTIQETQSAEAINVTDSKDPAPAKKGVMSASTAKKANGSPPTPTVKKASILNAGTFGAGSVKPTGAKAVTLAPAASKTAAPALKKSTTSAPAATSKPPMASSTATKPAGPAAASARRASVVPTKTSAPLIKTSLSASTNTKLSPDNVHARSSVASPTGSFGSTKAASATRPRASVSEAVKKAPLSSRPSGAAAKPTAPVKTTALSRSSAAAAPAKSSRPTGSISSIKEVKEDTKALVELQTQLDEATKALESKGATVSDLESQLEKLEASLAAASGEIESKAATVTESEEAKATAESQLQETQEELKKVRGELEEAAASLRSVQIELKDTNASAAAHNDVVAKLQGQIQELEAALSLSKEKAELLETNGAATSASALEAASIEHEALLKAQADFQAISEEAEALKAAHTKGQQDSQSQIAELQEKLAATESLEAQLTSLKAEKDENANKLSELEIEILELKESQDGLKTPGIIFNGELPFWKMNWARQLRLPKLDELVTTHQKELEAEAARYAEIVASLEALKAQHSETLAAHEQSKQEVLDKEEEHATKLAELEEIHAAKQEALSVEIDKITKELQSQEAIYNAKVDAVKAEHTQFLEDAFERARNEAADVHSLELQAFRASSNATIEEIKSANKVALDSLKADHASSLDTEVNGLQKQISKLKLELKATQDDLAKAKASLEVSHSEVGALTKQRDEARAQAEAAPTLSPEQATEITRLTNELSITKDDLAAMTDMLNLTKTSMTELSDNHKKELEEAAKGRADEALKLRSAHESEVTTFATQKSELLVKLSDMEGELATVRAALSAQQIASAKSNGNGSTHPPPSPGVTKEELTKMHEAHNLKIYDLQAEHEKAMKLVKEELEATLVKVGGLQQDIDRKGMEITYMEQEQEESQEQITRLKEDLDALSEKLSQQDKS
ncbi:hypothetical protein BDZ97DRAFT_1912331 [Flammula alnicola]|nr:hypothetical protein BDZ97DRAFT_1912331 [Flammula alnicola]